MSLIFILLYLLTPAFGQSFLWITGASNYLYGILIVLVFLIPYRLALERDVKTKNKLLLLGMALLNFFFGILAGCTNENNSVALICIIIGIIISIKFFYHRKIHLWMITGLIGSIFGCIFMLMSPGTSSRLSTTSGFGGIFTWIYRAIFITFDVCEYLFIGILLFVIVLICYFKLRKQDSIKEHIDNLLPMIIFLIGTFVSIYSMSVSPSFPDRAWSGPVVFFIITIGTVFTKFDLNININVFSTSLIIITIVWVCILGSCVNTFYVLKNVKVEYNARIESISSQISEGEKTIYLESIKSNSKYSCYSYSGDLSKDSSEWPNTAIARYYNVDRVEILH